MFSSRVSPLSLRFSWSLSSSSSSSRSCFEFSSPSSSCSILLHRLRLLQQTPLAAQDGDACWQWHKTLRFRPPAQHRCCAKADNTHSLSLCTGWRGVNWDGSPCGGARLWPPFGCAITAESRANYGRPWGCATSVEQNSPSLAAFMVVPCLLGKMRQFSAALGGCAVAAESRVSYGRPWGCATVSEERSPSLAAFMVAPCLLD